MNSYTLLTRAKEYQKLTEQYNETLDKDFKKQIKIEKEIRILLLSIIQGIVERLETLDINAEKRDIQNESK